MSNPSEPVRIEVESVVDEIAENEEADQGDDNSSAEGEAPVEAGEDGISGTNDKRRAPLS